MAKVRKNPTFMVTHKTTSTQHHKNPLTHKEQMNNVQKMCLDDDIKFKLKFEVEKVVNLIKARKEQKRKIELRKSKLLQVNTDETMLMLDGEYKQLVYTLSLIDEQCTQEIESLNQQAYNLLSEKYSELSSQYAKISSLMLDTLKTSKEFIKLLEKKPKYVKFFDKIKYHLTNNIPFPESAAVDIEKKYKKYTCEIASVYRRLILIDDKAITNQRLDEIAPFALELNLNDIMGVLGDIAKINRLVLIPIEQEYGLVYATHHLRFIFVEAYKKKVQSILNNYLKEIQGIKHDR